MNKVLSFFVAAMFLINNISLADTLATNTVSKTHSLNNLATQLRLKPITDIRFLDIFKLTAEIFTLAKEYGDLTSIERDQFLEISIDEIKQRGLKRKGDRLTFDFRKLQEFVTADGHILFIPCSIEALDLTEGKRTTRQYLLRAIKNPPSPSGYDYVFFTSEELGRSVDEAIQDLEFLATLADSKIRRKPSENKAIDRFREQQEEDRIIRESILNGTAKRLSMRVAWVNEIYGFLRDINPTLAEEFANLVSLGQLMVIHGLSKPHAGGIGIYLPDDEAYINATTVIHEVFAKCGFAHNECIKMENIASKTIAGVDLETEERPLLEKSRNASFGNRYLNPLVTDYWKRDWRKPTSVMLKEMQSGRHDWYLGIDSSTQSVTFTVIDYETKEIIWRHSENFEEDYYKKHFGTLKGKLPHPQAPKQFHTDPLMLAAALDRGMAELSRVFNRRGWDLGNLRAISGAGQQHGTVYYHKNAESVLRNLNPGQPLYEQLLDGGVFATDTAPIWETQDTEEEIKEIDAAFGGPEITRKTTGSKAELRFSLANMLKLSKRFLSRFKATHTVLNIAAYNGSLLTGMARFPFDPGDGAGTNAMHITKHSWLKKIIDRLAPGLSSKLPPIKPSDAVIGKISDYWVTKYGFSPKTRVVNFTGDNPSAVAGQGMLEEGQVSISLGTSYTMYEILKTKPALKKALECPIGHVFGEPAGNYMWLVCFQNGDETLAKLRDIYISDEEATDKLKEKGNVAPSKDDIYNMKIEIFTEELGKTQPGNNDGLMIPQHKDEAAVYIPHIPGKFYSRNLNLAKENRTQVFRAAVEGQIYFIKWVADQVGLDIRDIRITGGVSNNPVIRQIIADIFNTEVNTFKISDAVALGSAIRAAKAHKKVSWKEAMSGLTEIKDRTRPDTATVGIYKTHYSGFKDFLEGILKEVRGPQEAEEVKAGEVSFDQLVIDFLEGRKEISRVFEELEAVVTADRRITVESWVSGMINRIIGEGRFTTERLRRLDELLDFVLEHQVEVSKNLLSGNDKAVANCLIERLAVREVAERINMLRESEYAKQSILYDYFDVAEQNPIITPNAVAIRRMMDEDIKPVELPKEIRSLEFEELKLQHKERVVAREVMTGFTVSVGLAHKAFLKLHGRKYERTSPSRTAVVEMHPKANQYFMVEEGELVILAAPKEGSVSDLRAFVLKPGMVAKIDAGVLHIAINRTQSAKFYVYNEFTGRESPTPDRQFLAQGERRSEEKPATEVTCLGQVFDAARTAADINTGHISNKDILNYIERSLTVSQSSMQQVRDRFRQDMNKGLRGEPSSLAMIPSFPFQATGKERGDVVTFDFGGSHMRVKRIKLLGNRKYEPPVEKTAIIPEHLYTATSEEIFDFAAGLIYDFMKERGMSMAEKRPLSFIFSFEFNQTGLASGTIPKTDWSKGFVVADSVGKDPAGLLNEALDRKVKKELGKDAVCGMRVNVIANDTVGVKEAYSYRYDNCRVGMVLGTGENICVELKLEDVLKAWWGGRETPSGTIDINMESGAFNGVEQTFWDRQLDIASENVGAHISEKMISGDYLGEVFRLIVRDLIHRGILFKGKSSDVFEAESTGKDAFFKTVWLDLIISDLTDDLSGIKGLLERTGITNSTLEDRSNIKRICDLVTTRAARLAAATIAGTVSNLGLNLEKERVFVGIDGSIYDKQPKFAEKVRDAINELFGANASNVILVNDIDDAPSIGVAVLGAIAASMPSETEIDEAAGEAIEKMASEKPVIFMPQHFTSKERCRVLAEKEYTGAEFVSYNQKGDIRRLARMLKDYPGRKKIVIGFGLESDFADALMREDGVEVQNIIPRNYNNQEVERLLAVRKRDDISRQKLESLEKLVITDALLSASLPKENYVGTKSYVTLKSILSVLLPEDIDVDIYIRYLVGTGEIQAIDRLRYLINTQLRPITPFEHDRLRYIIKLFISA